MIPVFSSSPTSPNAVSSYTVRSQCLIGRRRELGETGMGPKGNVQSVIVLSFLAVVSISLLSRAAAQSSNSSWQPQSSVIEMWSEKRSEHNFAESRRPSDYRVSDRIRGDWQEGKRFRRWGYWATDSGNDPCPR